MFCFLNAILSHVQERGDVAAASQGQGNGNGQGWVTVDDEAQVLVVTDGAGQVC